MSNARLVAELATSLAWDEVHELLPYATAERSEGCSTFTKKYTARPRSLRENVRQSKKSKKGSVAVLKGAASVSV